ncbi:YncE family protein [Kitasatospora sp. CB02891]|uniref:YncE family protein n=1 Tax=Kitasatospora sp. CB02891 TaxID=2020329 RepID=UPI000C26F1A0|nr:hypothetical protein [Kitasatospora sp. CB02891]PJN27774.1 hypothetical protein CG736_06060 [Kitasatospora sp. CB02891]
MTGITAALTLPASGTNKATCYLFRGTWAARYELNGTQWEFKSPFDLPQHLTWFWPGLAGTAGHRPYPAAFGAKGEIYFLRPDHLVRYNIAKDEVQSEDDAKPENTFDVTKLPGDFLAELSGAMDTTKGVYLFSGTRWALFNLQSGSLKKHGTLGSSLPHGIDGGCWPDKAANGYLFSGDEYWTCTADTGGTLTAAAGGAVTDLWKNAPLKRPLADIYASGLDGKQPVRFRTTIDLSTDALPGTSPVTATGTVIKGADLRATWDRSSWSISGDGRHGFLVNGPRIVAVDLAKITSDDPVIRTKTMTKNLWDCALTSDGKYLWTGGDDTDKWGKMLHRVDVGAVDTQDFTVTSYNVSGAVYGIALSAKGDKVYPGVRTDNSVVQVPVTSTADGSVISTLSGDTDFGRPLVAVSVDGATVAFVIAAGKSVKTFKGQDAPRSDELGNLVTGLAMTPDGTRLCAVTLKDQYAAAVVDLTKADSTVQHIELPDIKYPRGVAVDPNGRYAYVAGYVSANPYNKARLWIIDLATATYRTSVEADWESTETEIDDVEIAWRWA